MRCALFDGERNSALAGRKRIAPALQQKMCGCRVSRCSGPATLPFSDSALFLDCFWNMGWQPVFAFCANRKRVLRGTKDAPVATSKQRPPSQLG
jgi:hypothetical protein